MPRNGVSVSRASTRSSTSNINDNGPANPYGSTIVVIGVNGFITDVNLILIGLRHDRPSDIRVMLDHGERAAIVIRRAGGNFDISRGNIVLDDQAGGTGGEDRGGNPLPANARIDGGRPYQPFD